jgi:hypothetical protein
MDWFLRRLADQLGVAPAKAGEAITPQLRFEQPWPQGLLLLVVGASAALIVWLYRREGAAPPWYKAGLATLRITLILLAVFMLSEAVLSVERTGLPYFIVMADDSASSHVVDQYADPTVRAAAAELARLAARPEGDRLAAAQGLLARDDGKWLRELQKQHKVKVYLAADNARSLADINAPDEVKPALQRLLKVEPAGAQTNLGDDLRQVLTELRGAPPTAILLLSDGQTTDGEPLSKAAELARQKGVPLFNVGLGDPEPSRDVELSDLLVDEVVFVDDSVRFDARLTTHGFAGQKLNVRLRRRVPGSTDPNRIEDLETVDVTAPPDGQATRVVVVHRPKQTGDITYILEIEPRPREIQTENNRIVRTINVRKEKLKVLFVEGEPRYEFRYLKNFLERDPTIDLGVVLLSADEEYSEQDPTALPGFPQLKEGPDGLFNFDVVLLGDADPSFLTAVQMRSLVEFVTQKGGGLMFIAGEMFNPLSYKGTPLEPLLPILLADARNPNANGEAITAFRPRLTAEGRSHPIFRFGDDDATSREIWDNLPELNWYFEAPRKQPGAAVLAEHPEKAGVDGKVPIMAYQFAGAGKSMFNAVDDTWRWRFRVGDRYFGRFWIQTIRFLARSKLLGQKQAEVTTDRRRYQQNQPIQIQVRFPNVGLAPAKGEVNVEVRRKGSGPRRLTLRSSPSARNVFEGALPQAQEGEYEVRLLPPPVLAGGLPTSTFRIDPPAGEFERVQMNEAELRRAANLSGGKFYTLATVDTLLKDLPSPQKVPLDTDPPIPLWNSWPILALFLTVVTAEWILRKRKQMV